MRVFRFVAVLTASLGGWALAPAPAWAQAPPTGPLVLHIPTSARTAALGNAWVAGRDLDAIFHNPAQIIGTRSTIDLSVARLGPASTMLSAGSIYAAGKWSLTLGWGAQFVGVNADAAPYPFSPDVTLASGARSGTSALFTAGAAIVFKKFRVGVAAKYVSDMASTSPAVFHPVRVNQHVLLADVGVARNLFGGAAAIAFQNIGRDSRDEGVLLRVPRQVALGWSTTKVAGPLDLAVFTQVTARRDWTTPAAGIEAGYSWIEGYTVTLRAGVRRPETRAEKPVSLGAALTADRVTVEYALRLYDGGRSSSGVTLRWR